MILAAEYIPSPLRLMLGLTRESGIGSGPRIGPDSRFFAGNRGENPRFPIWPGIGKSPDSRFGRESGIGVPIRRAGDFLGSQRKRQLRRRAA